MITINIPEKVKQVLDTLMAAGHEAYIVGGCVRDSLLSRIPNDWDVTTSANPKEIKALFRRTIDTGIEHGTVTVMIGSEGFEVTTYRIDGKYEDARHPSSVTFTTDLAEDLRRRDFTINAMAYNPQTGLVDIFGGQDDIANKIVRAVGVARERFTEDALRIMRAVRFAAQLGYNIDEDTKIAAKELAPNLKKVSAERINVELVKLLTSDHPELIRTAYELSITKQFMPEFDLCMETEQNHPHHKYSVGEHTIHSVCNIKSQDFDRDKLKTLRLGMLLHDIGKPACKITDEKGIDHFTGHQEVGARIANEILRRLKFDNKTREDILLIIKYHDVRPELTLPEVKRVIRTIGFEVFELLFTVQNADIMAQSEYLREEKLKRIEDVKCLYEEIVQSKDPIYVKDLAINGKDIIKLGIASGREIGNILNYLNDEIILKPELNEYDILINIVKDKYSEGNSFD